MIRIEHLSKYYKKNKVLDDINITIEDGEIVSLVGPSGHGKTTLLRCIQGLETYEGVLQKEGCSGFVFQHFYLFPHMTVINNITYSLIQVQKMPQAQAYERALYFLKKLHLEDKIDVYPHSLSGGQKQRAALIRALVMMPDILLLDEPTSALDFEIKQIVVQILKEYQNGKRIIILISHDLDFAKSIATRNIILKNGIIHS